MVNITVEKAENARDWNAILEESTQGSPFHRHEFLAVCADHHDARLHPYVAYKGEEPIGLFPMFELRKGPFTAAFSPLPDLKIHYLGPVTLYAESMKSRKREVRNRRFIDAVLEAVDRDINPRYLTVRTTPNYDDDRPFLWADYDATPRHTYVVDLTRPEEDILAGFSADLRRTLDTEAEGFEVEPATPAEVERIIEEVVSLHERKDADYNLTPAFVREVQRALPEDAVRAHVCRYEGEFCGGEVSLEHDGTVYGWQSAADVSVPLPVYDLLYWHTFRAAKDRGCTAYDLLGANDPDLCTYKAKFAPELRQYRTLTRGSPEMRVAAKLYKRLR